MHNYTATVTWENQGPDFLNNQYSRSHQWIFDGGYVVQASAAPDIVPPPWSVAENVDPEEAFVASLASCHMLFFLYLAGQQGISIESYTDQAEGVLGKNNEGKMAMTKVILHPRPVFTEELSPDAEKVKLLHRKAHEQCFIANSVTTEIIID